MDHPGNTAVGAACAKKNHQGLEVVPFTTFWYTFFSHPRNNAAPLSAEPPMASAPAPPPPLEVPTTGHAPNSAAVPTLATDEPSGEEDSPEWTAGIQWRSVLSYRELFEAVDPEELLRKRAQGFGNAKQLNNTLKGMRLAGIKKGYNSRVATTHTAASTKVATLMRRQLRRKGYRVSQVNLEKPLEVEFAVDQ